MRVSEVYASIQGEGPTVGSTTVFLRFGGCNLRCPGWPCDTVHAIDPKFRKEWVQTSPSDLLKRVVRTAELAGAKQVTLTGGEPFLQPNAELETLTSELQARGYKLEAFTNGTLLYPDWATKRISMIMDWKLPGSGEDPLNKNRFENLRALDEAPIFHSVKFVCKDEADFYCAMQLWEKFPDSTKRAVKWYYGKVWSGRITDAQLAELVMVHGLPWKMNVQLHNYIWPVNERGR